MKNDSLSNSKKMLRSHPIILILLFIIATWLSAIFWVPSIASFIIDRSPECLLAKESLSEANTNACIGVVSKYGATGDLFGAVTSLFSALGLFAVAYTVHIESKARKAQLKPFPTCKLDTFLSIQDPSLTDPFSVKISIPMEIGNVGEIALNASVSVIFEYNNTHTPIGKVVIEGPLVSGTIYPEEIIEELKENSFTTILTALTAKQNNNSSLANGSEIPKSILNVEILCNNLEGLQWSTKVSYNISVVGPSDRDKLLALLHDSEDKQKKWDGKASAALSVNVIEGSWRYQEKT